MVGGWNLFGCVMLVFCVYEPFADKVFREWTYFLTKPYEHGSLGHFFILWICILNGALGIFLIKAPAWNKSARNAILITAIISYALCVGLAIAGLQSPNYGPGLYIAIILWAGLLAWAIAAKRVNS